MKYAIQYILTVDYYIFGFQEDKKEETHFQVALSCISQSLKTQIINRSYDEVAICFFNTVCCWPKTSLVFT